MRKIEETKSIFNETSESELQVNDTTEKATTEGESLAIASESENLEKKSEKPKNMKNEMDDN